MLIDFMSSCIPVFREEGKDYSLILRAIEEDADPFIGFLPAIIEDTWPIHIMENTNARRFNHHTGNSVYMVPYGAYCDEPIGNLDNILRKWYDYDVIDLPSRDYGDLEAQETILLRSDIIQTNHTFSVQRCGANILYLKMISRTYRTVHVIVIVDTPDSVWKNIVNQFHIKTDIIIDSHKGLGSWFEESKLYTEMVTATSPELLPEYYFEGKYISHDPPKNFEKAYNIPEAEGRHWCDCSIYKTKW